MHDGGAGVFALRFFRRSKTNSKTVGALQGISLWGVGPPENNLFSPCPLVSFLADVHQPVEPLHTVTKYRSQSRATMPPPHHGEGVEPSTASHHTTITGVQLSHSGALASVQCASTKTGPDWNRTEQTSNHPIDHRPSTIGHRETHDTSTTSAVHPGLSKSNQTNRIHGMML